MFKVRTGPCDVGCNLFVPASSVPELSPSFLTGDEEGVEVKQWLGSPSMCTESLPHGELVLQSVSVASGIIPTLEFGASVS